MLDDYLFSRYDAGRKALSRPEGMDQLLVSLERRMNRLALASEAMWELLRASGDYDDCALADKMLELELRSARENGLPQSVAQCPHCRQQTNVARSFCIMCGEHLGARAKRQLKSGLAR